MIAAGKSSDVDSCIEIAKSLPDFFTETAITNISTELRENTFYVASVNEKIIGFVIVEPENTESLEITWLAVDPSHQAHGIGSNLIEFVESEAKNKGFADLEVKTLAETDGDEGYQKTRKFYEKNGFKLIEVVDDYPGWDPGNPCAIFRKEFTSSDSSRRLPRRNHLGKLGSP